MAIRRIVSVPIWDQGEAAEDELRLRINVGRGRERKSVFGFGAHESTRRCLALLGGLYAEGAPRPARVLDVGCGTGILSIACARLGASEALGVDIDPDSPPLADENARHNGVSDRCRFTLDPAGEVEGTFDLVLANLPSADVSLQLCEVLCARARGGLLILSGFTDKRRDEVVAAYEARGRVLRSETREGPWCGLLFR